MDFKKYFNRLRKNGYISGSQPFLSATRIWLGEHRAIKPQTTYEKINCIDDFRSRLLGRV